MQSDQHELLGRGVAEVVVRASLEKKLRSGKKLNIKHGVDPTTADLHLGHAVIYEKLRQFQQAGHTIQFLIGGFTARFGDPTDRAEKRSLRSAAEVHRLAKKYVTQLAKILDIDKVEVRSNAEWYDKMSAEDFLHLLSQVSTQRMLERDMFQQRMKEGKEIGLHEITYPLLQGYDSVMLKADVTVIGRDQTFNELQARPLQEVAKQPPQDLVIMPLLVGTDGKRKMSQSYGNAILLSDSPKDMYGKLMRIPDEQIITFFTLLSRLPMSEVDEIAQSLRSGANPRDAKAKLAHTLVTQYHSAKDADKAATEFQNVFQKGATPDEVPEFEVKSESALLEILVDAKLVSSKSEGRRMLEQGAVRIDGKVEKDGTKKLDAKKTPLLQVGKRRFVRLI